MLASLQDQLNVTQQITGAAQMQAQKQATINTLVGQGKSEYDAMAIAAGQLSIAQASATASVQQEIQALQDANALILAKKDGTEAATAAAIAYRKAMDSGANGTAAAALTETLKNRMLQTEDASGAAAKKLELARKEAERLAKVAADANALFESMNQHIAYDGTTLQKVGDQLIATSQDIEENGGYLTNFDVPAGRQYESSSPLYNMRQATSQQLINGALSGGVNSALSQLMGTYAENNRPHPFSGRAENRPGANQSEIYSAVSQLFDLKLAMAGDNKSAKEAIYKDQLAWLQTQPMTISNMRQIVDLTRSLRDLQNSTDALTEAQKASLNPLYSGKGALAVGYYKAASGLDMIAQGPPSGDQVPFHAMVNGGERITITPAGQSNDDKPAPAPTTINQTFNFGGTQGNSRRSQRQFAQGFGQTVAALKN